MNKFPVTEKALENIKAVMTEQDLFGLVKYGKPLDSKDNYDWLAMFMQEMADGLKYIQCEIERKTYVLQLLEAGLRSDNPKDYMEVAIDLLSVTRTGKEDEK